MRILVTAVTGQLGHDVFFEALKRGHQVIGSGSKDMRVFVTGVAGQLGHNCVNELAGRGHEVVGSDIAHIAAPYSGVNDPTPIARTNYVQLDITDEKAVKKTVERIHPDVIIHCAAWIAVDTAEDEENKEKVHAINVLGTQYIAEAAKAVDAKMVGFTSVPTMFSTDRVSVHGNPMINATLR